MAAWDLKDDPIRENSVRLHVPKGARPAHEWNRLEACKRRPGEPAGKASLGQARVR
jgi:hypothetical protein